MIKDMSNHNIVCHADGERCLGCNHYHGLSDKCVYAGKTDLKDERSMEWQPIETAPVNTPILITDGETVTATLLAKCGGDPKWMSGHGFDGYEWEYDFTFNEATHWMLLPEPPEDK